MVYNFTAVFLNRLFKTKLKSKISLDYYIYEKQRRCVSQRKYGMRKKLTLNILYFANGNNNITSCLVHYEIQKVFFIVHY